ncbi:phage holin family protein [Aurantibacillus circumpalustris]|uniref:phage holin family protein n=1 Tax=Aurantibacillus circumpalustris TaxID=3036359 RepID=UPI00295B839C|nr:phage holin family protein [Aurantibacillus circumpalustris]
MRLIEEKKIEDLLMQLKTYSNMRIELIKLKTIEKAAVTSSYLLSNLLPILAFVISVVFLSTAMAFYLSQQLGNIIWGFTLVGLFYILLAVILFLLKKKLVGTPVKNKIISTLTKTSFN